MSANYRIADPRFQKISRGMLLVGPVGGSWLENVGNCLVGRQINSETTDLKTVEDPMMPIVRRITTAQNEMLKVVLRSFNPIACALAFMSPEKKIYTQNAINAGTATIPAGARDGQIYDFVGPDGKQVFDVVVTPEERLAANIVVHSHGGSFEVIGNRAVESDFEFTCPAITAEAKLGVYRRMQRGEVRVRARFVENNRWGQNLVHNWPVTAFRATGEQKLSDEGNEVQAVETEALVEYDNNAIGEERGTIRELNSFGGEDY